MAADNSIPLSWILLFLVLALGIGVGAVYFVGGNILSQPGFVAGALA